MILAEKYLRHKEGTSFHETLVFRNSSTDGEEKNWERVAENMTGLKRQAASVWLVHWVHHSNPDETDSFLTVESPFTKGIGAPMYDKNGPSIPSTLW